MRTTTVTGSGEGKILSRTVNCPAGYRATGGGFGTQAPTNYPFVPFIRVYESRKAKQGAWKVQGQITDPKATGKTRTLQAFVYCSDSAAATTSVFTTRPPSFGGQFFKSVEAKCPQGKRAKAGGFRGPPPNFPKNELANHTVTSSVLRDEKRHDSSFGAILPTITFTSYVYCSKEGKIGTSSGFKQSGGYKTPLTVLSKKCTSEPAAGGFEQPLAQGQNLGYYSEFWQSFRVGKKWQVSAIHNGSGSTHLFSYAYCSVKERPRGKGKSPLRRRRRVRPRPRRVFRGGLMPAVFDAR